MGGFVDFVNACLLHDIGKIVLRVEGEGLGKNHAEAGAEWLSKLDQGHLRKTISLVKAHHYSQDAREIPLLALLQKADHLAAGEREASKEKCKDCYKWDWYVPLAVPFSRISLKKPRPAEPYPAFWPVEAVCPVFPQASSEPQRATPEKYVQILQDMEKDFLFIFKNSSPSPNKFLVILEKYLSFVPSETCVPKEGYKDWPDISLFDHLKLTGAVGSAYYLWCEENFGHHFSEDSSVAQKILSSDTNRKPFLLAGGDISGVQNFIYTISSEGALCSLKGRSFFLELLIEHVIERILAEVGLYRCNVIFSGGGHFYLLLPNIEKSEKALKKIRSEINEWLWKNFGEALELHIVWEPFGEEVFLPQKYGVRAGEVFVRISEKLQQSKKKPFWGKLSRMFKPTSVHPSCFEEGGGAGACEVCFRDEVEVRKRSENLELLLCEACWQEFQLGKNIQNQSRKDLFCSYLNISSKGIVKIENTGYEFDNKPQNGKYFAVNHFKPGADAFLPCGYYQGIWELDKVRDEGFGLPRLAALRMDVDNLGRIFKEGLLPEDQTFSRVSAISRSLNLFFKYYLNGLLCEGEYLSGYELPERFDWAERNVAQKGRKVAIVYAGGDDLFILGDWLDVCECAVDIVEAFFRYTGHPELTLSGGLVLGHIKKPVYQFAHLAGAGEEKAKNLRSEKNALFILSEVIPNENLKNLKEMLYFWKKYLEPDSQKVSLILKKSFSTTFLYQILNIAQELSREDNKEEKAIFLPRIAYLLSRLNRQNLGKDYLTLQNWLLSLDFEKNWKLLYIVMQWIIMSMRR